MAESKSKSTTQMLKVYFPGFVREFEFDQEFEDSTLSELKSKLKLEEYFKIKIHEETGAEFLPNEQMVLSIAGLTDERIPKMPISVLIKAGYRINIEFTHNGEPSNPILRHLNKVRAELADLHAKALIAEEGTKKVIKIDKY